MFCIWARIVLRAASVAAAFCSSYSLSNVGLQYWLSDEEPIASHRKICRSAFGSGFPDQPHSSMS